MFKILKTFKAKLITQTVIINLILIIAFSFTYIISYNNIKIKTQDNIKTVIDTLNSIVISYDKTILENPELKDSIKEDLRQRFSTVRYGNGNYATIQDSNDFKFLMHPVKALEGKGLNAVANKFTTDNLEQILAKSVDNEKKFGFIEYDWKDEKGNPIRKFGYAIKIDSFGWILTTGVDDKELTIMMREVATLFIISISIVLFTSIFITIFFIKRIKRVVKDATSGILNLTTGDIKDPLINYGAETEFNVFFESIELFRKYVAESMAIIKDKIAEISSSAEELSATSESFSNSAQSQASSLEEITATMEEISANSEHSYERVLDQKNKTDGMITDIKVLYDTVMKAGGVMNDALGVKNKLEEALVKLLKSSGESKESLSNTLKKVEDISTVIDMIEEISDQINLLSLNAKIEASRYSSAESILILNEVISTLKEFELDYE